MSDVLGAWADILIDKARERAGKQKNEATKKASEAFLDILSKHKDSIIALGENSVLEMLGMIGRGDTMEAKELFIRKAASAEDLISDMENGAHDIANAPDVDWGAKALEFIADVGIEGAKILLPLLIGLL